MTKFHILLLAFSLLTSSTIYAQNIDFTDERLKTFLINENCVDLDNDDSPDRNADLNGDNEIQESEALAINALKIGDFPDSYYITSLEDLTHFSELSTLIIIHNDSLTEVSSLNMENLSFLWISSCRSLKHIDISDLTNIEDLRIEDIDSLDYLNIQNGNHPDGIFSLFYTEDIAYACVDSIADEYEEVSFHMRQGLLPSINCTPLNNHEPNLANEGITLYPNPTSGVINIDSHQEKLLSFTIFDTRGIQIPERYTDMNEIDISTLPSGVYIFHFETEDGLIVSKRVLKLE